MSSRIPDLVSDDDFDSTASEESSSSEFESGSSDDNDWPVGLKDVVGDRPSAKDYDQNGKFRASSDYFTTSDEDTREVLSVTETDPLIGDYVINGHVSEREANKENLSSGATAAKKLSPAPQPGSKTQPEDEIIVPLKKKPLIMDVPPYNKDPEVQARNIKNFYSNLLKNYTDYYLEDVSKKCQEFTLKTRSEVEVAVIEFYDKAVTDVSHAQPLASLCNSMKVHKIHGMMLFRETMLSFCQKKFLQIKGEVNVIEEVSAGKFTDCKDLTFELQNETHLENWMRWTEVEENMRCHMIFLGELYNFGELPIKVILGRVLKMFETKGSRHLDFLSIGGIYELMRVAGPKLDVELQNARADVTRLYNSTVDNIKELGRDKTYPERVQDKLQDILQLKENGWKGSSDSDKGAEHAVPTVKPAKSTTSTQKSTEKVTSAAQTEPNKTAVRVKSNSAVQSTPTQNTTKSSSSTESSQSTAAVRSKSSTRAKGAEDRSRTTGLNISAPPYVPPSRDTRRTSPPTVRTSPQPLVVKPTSPPKPSSNDGRINNQIKDNLSKAWRNVADSNYTQAITNYNECLILFSVLNSPHELMEGTLVCLYILLTVYETKDTTVETDSLYRKIVDSVNYKDFPFVDYVHLTQLSKGCEDFKVVLTHFTRLNKAVEESWSAVYYPLSQRLLEESAQDKMRDWLKGFVTSKQYAYKDTFKKCVFEGCTTPGLYIVEYEDFDTPETYEVLECTEKCKQYYHHRCFKSLGKWNIDGTCLTPDCSGRIIRLYEKKVVKRESKTPVEPKKGKEKAAPHPPQSPKSKKRNKKRQDSVTKETKDSTSEPTTTTTAAPPPAAPSPPPPPPLTPSPEPQFTGDDIVDMFGTMLIYLEEYPATHMTTVVMEMNSIYSWVKVEVFHEFLDIGVKSLIISNKGLLDLAPGTDEKRNKMKEKDIKLLIDHYKNSPISSLKQKIDSSNSKPAEAEKPKTSEPKKHQTCEKAERQYKRLTKTSGGKPDTKENTPPEQSNDRVKTPDVPVPVGKQRSSLSASLNPGAREFSPPVTKSSPSAGFNSTAFPSSHQNVLAPEFHPRPQHVAAPVAQMPLSHVGAHHHVIPPQHVGAHPQQLGALPPNNIHNVVFNQAAASLHNPPVHVGAPIRPTPEQASYAERKNLLERISELENMLDEVKNKYEKEINHMKTQLVDQLDTHTKLKAKAKQYKQEAKNAQDIIQDYTKLQSDHEKILKQMEEERKNWLSERTGKSVESKKLIVTMKIEIEEANKRNRELQSKSDSLQKENVELKERLQNIESDLFSRDQTVMKLKSEVLDLNKKYKGTQQQHVLERYNTAQLRLRVAYANCEAQIRERSKLENPEFYFVSNWQQCQSDIKNRIDDNNHLYQEYVASLHNSEDMEVRFEVEPQCPTIESDVPVLPLQRFDDILLGRPAPPLPSPTQQIDELNVLADLMRDSTQPSMPSFMAQSDTSQIPNFPNNSHLIASTPANLASNNTHFQFTDLDLPSTNTTTRPPTNTPSTQPPSSTPFDLAAFMTPSTRQPQPDAHYQIADSPSLTRSETLTRQPMEGGFAQSGTPDSIPSSAIPSSAIPNLAGSNRASPVTPAVAQPVEPPRPTVRGRGRARQQRSGQSTVPSAPGVAKPSPPPGSSNPPPGITSPPPGITSPPQPPPAQTVRAPPAAARGTALKERIKQKFPFLADKEINQYLKRVKADTDSQNIKVTPSIAMHRVSILVESDYPSAPPDPTVPVTPEKTCVICHEALNLLAVSQLGCGHDFHKTCVDQWFATQNHTCPTCRSHQPPVDMFPPLSR